MARVARTGTCPKCSAQDVRLFSIKRLDIEDICEPCGRKAIAENPLTPDQKAEKARKRRNAIARDRYAMMKSLGLVKTPYGWE